MNLSVEQTQFTDVDELELPEYRPLNRLAVLSAILGILSILALLHSVLIFIPIVGLAVGLLAARQLASPESTQSGHAAAKWGIFLSLVFAFGVGTNELYRQKLIADQARICADSWLRLIRDGKLFEAHQLTTASEVRVNPGASLKEYYAPRERKKPEASNPGETSPDEMLSMMEPTPHERFKEFFSRSVPKRLSELGNKAKWEYLRTSEQSRLGTSQMSVTQLFGVSHDNGGQTKRFVIEIQLERTVINRIASWRIVNVTDGSGG